MNQSLGSGIDNSEILSLVYGTTIAVIAVVSIIGNAIVIFVFGRRCRRKINVFRISLAACELLSPLLTYWMTASSAFNRKWLYGNAGCKYYGFTSGWLALTSIACLTAIAIERYKVVSSPFSKRRWTFRVKTILATSTWFYAIVLTLPPLFGWSRYRLEAFGLSCCFDYYTKESSVRSFIAYLFIGGLIAPICIISYCYFKIFAILKLRQLYLADFSPNYELTLTVRLKRSRGIPDVSEIETFASQQHRRSVDRREMQLTRVILTVTFVFVLCWIPYALNTLVIQFGPESWLFPEITLITNVCAKFSTVFNPFIYWYKDDHFRRSLRCSFGCGSTDRRN